MSDDGARRQLDSARVLDEWYVSNYLVCCGEANVTAGLHEIRAEYCETVGRH